MKIWILTECWNDYNQHGNVFVAAFLRKPTAEQLKEHGVVAVEVEHVLNGGGQQSRWEDSWYILTEEDLTS